MHKWNKINKQFVIFVDNKDLLLIFNYKDFNNIQNVHIIK